MSGRGGCDARVLQVQQISPIVAPLLHPKSLIINVCSTVAGGWGAEYLSINLSFLAILIVILILILIPDLEILKSVVKFLKHRWSLNRPTSPTRLYR